MLAQARPRRCGPPCTFRRGARTRLARVLSELTGSVGEIEVDVHGKLRSPNRVVQSTPESTGLCQQLVSDLFSRSYELQPLLPTGPKQTDPKAPYRISFFLEAEIRFISVQLGCRRRAVAPRACGAAGPSSVRARVCPARGRVAARLRSLGEPGTAVATDVTIA